MKGALIISLALLLGCLNVQAAPVVAQASACLSQADSVNAYLGMVRQHYAYSDSASVVSAGNPWADTAAIAHVTVPSTCQDAVHAYNAALGRETAQQDTAAYVFSIGSSGYAYVRPGDTSEGRQHYYIFTVNWVLKATMLG
jgi:hypothetical protein